MLRGPQTVGELRINSERLHRFADISSVEAFLRELAERPEGALVVELPRQAGSRERRWSHLLSGAPAFAEDSAEPSPAVHPLAADTSELAALRDEVARLAADLEQTKALVMRLCKASGIDP
jgi:uncharacterized protein YceH (UPF0502 family)